MSEVWQPPSRGLPRALLGVGLGALAGTGALAASGPQAVLLLSWLVAGFALVPALLCILGMAIALVLSLLLALLGLPWLLRGRPTGLSEVLREAWGLALGIAPGYLGALRRARRPILFGAAAGFAAVVLAWLLCGSGLAAAG